MPEKVETRFLKILAAACAVRYNRSHYDGDRKVILDMFARNGGRICLDCGQHPETSTPECLTLRQAVLYDKAAERILEEALKKTNRRIRRNGRGARKGDPFWLVKNNSHNEETYGSHENYMVRRQIPFREELADLIMPFLVTRQIFCGTGTVLENGFEISQRARFIKDDISALSRDFRDSEQSRAILHFKDSSRNSDDVTLADSDLWRRLHLILGDSNISEYTAWLKLGTTALVLRMIEDRRLDRFIRLIQPVECFHRISRDRACRRKIQVIAKNELDSRWQTGEMTAVQIQELYLEQTQNYLSGNSGELPLENRREFKEITEEWKKVLQKLKSDPMLLKEEIDWVMKKNLLEKYKENRGIGWDHPDLKIMDILYHHIDRDQGLYYLLEREGKARRIFGDEEIKKAKNRPPETRTK